MANINQYLAAIMSATYGEEVRGSIHDAIEAMNEESSDAKSAAETAQDSAQASATAAANSATAASNAKTAAQNAQSAAESANSEAQTAKTDAQSAKTAAQTAATNAGTSATNAASSAASALESKNSVDDKVADVMSMKSNLMKFHAVYDPLFDSSGNEILDSSGNPIYGQVLYADVSDVIALQNQVNALITYCNLLTSEFLLNRIEVLEKKLSEEVEVNIAHLQEHSLLDDQY